MSSRVTRARSKQQNTEPESPLDKALALKGQPSPSIEKLPKEVTPDWIGSQANGFDLLQAKQLKLRSSTAQIPKHIFRPSLKTPANKKLALLAQAAGATLAFAQGEAGTAVCISPSGVLLTCSHCIAETEDELDREAQHWLLFASGQIVKAKCVAWDAIRDLALLQIVASQTAAESSALRSSIPRAALVTPDLRFPTVSISHSPPSLNNSFACIGQPGPLDLETSDPDTPTNYDILHHSTGLYRGLAKGQDPQDNSEIGALKHDCWTYWGHSGAPLFTTETGEEQLKLAGLHSSWDDETGMRRGVPWAALWAFLDEWTIVVVGQE